MQEQPKVRNVMIGGKIVDPSLGGGGTPAADSWSEARQKARAEVNGQLLVWGYVAAYRECGGVGYPASLNGGNGGDQSNYGLPDLGASYCAIEKALKGTAPVVRGMLHFQYVRPHLNFAEAQKEQDRNIQQLATTAEDAVALVEEQAAGQESISLSSMAKTLSEFVEQVYGDDVPEHQRKSLAGILGSIRKRWMDGVVNGMLPGKKR